MTNTVSQLKQKYYVIDEDGCSDREVVEKVNELIGILNEQQAAIKKVCRDFDKVNDELARLNRENEELKKNQATKEVI